MKFNETIKMFDKWYDRAFKWFIPYLASHFAFRDMLLADVTKWSKTAYRHPMFYLVESTGEIASRHTVFALSFLLFVPIVAFVGIAVLNVSLALSATAFLFAFVSSNIAFWLIRNSFGDGIPYVEAGMKVLDADEYDGALGKFLERESAKMTLAATFRAMKYAEKYAVGSAQDAYMSFCSHLRSFKGFRY